MRLVGAHSQVMQLHLRLRPRERYRALERGGIVMLVSQIERFRTGRRDHRPEGHPRRCTRRYSHPAAKTEDRIEYCSDCIGKRPSVDCRDRRMSVAPAPKETRAVGFELYVAD